MSIANGDSYTLRWTFTGVSGSTNGQGIGLDNFSITLNGTPAPVNTTVSFAGSDLSVNENDGTANLTLAISNFSTTQSTSVEVALTSGDAARVNNYTTQTVTWAANDGANKTVTLTISDDALCTGNAALVFTLQNISGGQGTPSIGTPSTRNVAITDNETPADPVATAATAVGVTGFTANWNAVPGATGYFLDVYELVPTNATDLFISEYVEGSSNNKYIEIFNGTGATVDLSDYRLRLYTNGSGTASNDVQLSGTLASGATVVYRNGAATIYGGSATSNTAVGFNGDDAVALFKISSSANVDIFGRIGEDPGAAWTGTGGRTTVDATLVRNSGVLGGVTTNPGSGFPTLDAEWQVFGIDNVANLGSHTYNGQTRSYVTGYNNASVGNVTTLNIIGLDPLTTYYYVVRSTGGCSTGEDSNEISATTLPVPAYYSQGNGNVNDPIWATTPSGTPGMAVWTPGSSMVVQAGDTVTVNAGTSINDLTTEAGSRLVIGNEILLSVYGDLLTLEQFSVSAANGEVELVSTSPVTVNSTGVVAFNNLTVNTPAGTTVNGGVNIFGTLLLADGDFDATNATVRLRSDANRTGRLGPVAGTADYLGDLVVERYIPGGATNWRMLGSPVDGATVAEWNDDFFTAGFPGSDYPNFIVDGQPWPSIRRYDESNTGTGQNDGLIGVAGVSEALVPGRGYAVWCGDNLGGTNPFLIEVPGQPVIAAAPVTLPMTYTNTGTPLVDGYNLVSNPLPSPISFAAINRGADVLNQYLSYNPTNGNISSWNGVIGTNGATNVIQSSQAFYLKATGTSVTTTVDENAKVASNAGGLFGADGQTGLPLLRLTVGSTLNSYSDEVVVVFQDGTPAFGGGDVSKVVFSHPEAPHMALRSTDGEDLAIDMYGAFSTDISIPVLVNAPVSGTYTVTAAELTSQVGLSCFSLEDLLTGVITPLTEGASYSFAIEAGADATQPRLVLRATAPVPFNTTNATCANTPNGQATVEGVAGPVDITWTDAFGNVLLQQTGVSGSATFGGLAAGSYSVRLGTTAVCGELVSDFTITAPFELEAVAEVVNATCGNTADGTVDVLVMGGVAPYTYLWSDNSTNEDLVAAAGVYNLTVTDANNCTWTSEAYLIDSNGPEAAFTASAELVTVGVEVAFQSFSEAESLLWDLGDGTTSEGAEVVHTYMQPGTYTVTLTVADGLCTDQASMEITVELTTGVAFQNVAGAVNAWATPNNIVIEHGLNNQSPLRIELLDATGRLHLQRQVAATPGRILIPSEGLATGIWFVRMTNGDTLRTVRVPVVR
ncbi:MAG: lamin tail domain-containing protein [Flavobacteriales bacterium]|nr:lamin tail domain-containing protein [Flavobacteriales bacterium]